ncbi:hypothetical protein SDC9_206500 [bioreactor metagenome]|uniref:Uncharacterized protein n=1 Tax=bioreactor metagenome TaxID=1076179 RepID=A0A645J4Z5_9ZZZZ
MLLADNAGQLRILKGIPSVKALDCLAKPVYQLLLPPGRDPDMVGRHAGLPGVYKLAPGNAPRRQLQVGVVGDDAGGFSPQLEGDGGEVPGGGGHDHPSHRRGAGKEDGIKPLLQEIGGGLHATLHYRHILPGEGGAQHP